MNPYLRFGQERADRPASHTRTSNRSSTESSGRQRSLLWLSRNWSSDIGHVGNGPYQSVTEIVSDIHALVIMRLDPQPGLRWLDLAYGTGQLPSWRPGRVRGSLASTSLLIERRRSGHKNRHLQSTTGSATASGLSSPTLPATGCHRPTGSCSRPTMQRQLINWRASLHPAARSPSPTGHRRAAWVKCSR